MVITPVNRPSLTATSRESGVSSRRWGRLTPLPLWASGDTDDDEDTPDDDLPGDEDPDDQESNFDDFDDEFDDDFEEEENDPDWDHPDDLEPEPLPPGKGGGKKK
jgi:hypothetical protein